MVTREDVESFLLRTEQGVEEIEPGMWVLDADGGRMIVHYSPPLLLLRVDVLEAPKEEARQAPLFRHLLELNANDLVYGAYALEDGEVILTDTLELEHLDFHTLQASIDSLQVALASHREGMLNL